MKKVFTILILSIIFLSTSIAQKNLTILLVSDNSSKPYITDSIRHAITDAGYSFVDYDAVNNGVPTDSDLSPYELVIWTTGNDASTNFWSTTDTSSANESLKTYLDNGGMLMIEGIDWMKDAFGAAPDTFKAGDFCYDYLGIEQYAAQAKDDDGVVYSGLPMMVAVPDNGICTTDTVKWHWSTMWHADAIVPTSTAKSIYKMGPSDYDFAGKSCVIYNEKGDAKILSAFIRWDGFKSADLAYAVTGEILDYFNQFSTASNVAVSSIDITGGTEITENNGTLQLSATVLPDDATIKVVKWSIGAGSVAATIDQKGLLTASGLDSENGKVYVIASATDNSGIADTAEITISNQTLGDGYKVLLVNDNANGTTRYLDIDTALAASGYTYKIYNAAVEQKAPSANYLSNFNIVLWYTGNDGANLYFWDVSDSAYFTCNSALKTYADNGGVVWLQGLDFLYDVYGRKYTAANSTGDSIIAGFSAGDFAYDYLGIKSYVAQSHANDGGPGVAQLDIAENNDITTINPIKWVYSGMWYVDALEATDNANPLYYMGPDTYDFSLYYAMLYNKKDKAQFVSSTFETARLDTQDNTNELVKEVIDYFKKQNETSAVERINNDAISFSVYPNPADNQLFVNYKLDKPQTINIRITDLSGKTIINKQINTNAGLQTQNLNIKHLSQGIYNLSIYTSEFISNQRIVVVK